MRVLRYRDLKTRGVAREFDKVCKFIEADDFKSADVKKLNPGRYYRASLGYANRLLLQFVQWQGDTVCLALEVIENHAYDRSRFLRGAVVDASKVDSEPVSTLPISTQDAVELRSLSAHRTTFEIFDKPIVFDDIQEEAVSLPCPLVIIGAAGSGKTAVTLSKLRQCTGRILYVTLSPYLARSARGLYESNGYQNPEQEVEFYSFREFLETLQVPSGHEVTLAGFTQWFARHRDAAAKVGMDSHALFEEFRGVLSAHADGPLTLAAYLALGVRQSLAAPSVRPMVFAMYEKYRAWMVAENYFDSSVIAHQLRSLAAAVYDFVVVDEVQDMTPVQLSLVLATLKQAGQFLLCGDSHQIVYPNFFSWAAVKTMFWHGLATATAATDVHILKANFRNTKRVTEVSNRLLKLKQARFGSVDRESSFLISSESGDVGEVALQHSSAATLRTWDTETQRSVNHAIIVLRDEDKPSAKAAFRTPLIFSVQEAKGLEYLHVVLFNMVSGQRQVYQQICEGVDADEVTGSELQYRRAKDREDKSLEIYKFYVNALYVAMTRAMATLTILESDTNHQIFKLLDVREQAVTARAAAVSSKDQWALEARKLEQQGKLEQARAIRESILQEKPVPWPIWTQEFISGVIDKALNKAIVNIKARQTLLDFALWHQQHYWLQELDSVNFLPASTVLYAIRNNLPTPIKTEMHKLRARFEAPYSAKNTNPILWAMDSHGPNHYAMDGITPLMGAARVNNVALIKEVLAKGADPSVPDQFGHTAWGMFLSTYVLSTTQQVTPAQFDVAMELLAPPTIDVQAQGRLVRLDRRHAEYWFFTMMQFSMKSRLREAIYRFTANKLAALLCRLPLHIWPENRRKSTYIRSVLARAAVGSSYQPARNLWTRIITGTYAISPDLSLRIGDDWKRFHEVMSTAWITRGNGHLYVADFKEFVEG